MREVAVLPLVVSVEPAGEATGAKTLVSLFIIYIGGAAVNAAD